MEELFDISHTNALKILVNQKKQKAINFLVEHRKSLAAARLKVSLSFKNVCSEMSPINDSSPEDQCSVISGASDEEEYNPINDSSPEDQCNVISGGSDEEEYIPDISCDNNTFHASKNKNKIG